MYNADGRIFISLIAMPHFPQAEFPLLDSVAVSTPVIPESPSNPAFFNNLQGPSSLKLRNIADGLVIPEAPSLPAEKVSSPSTPLAAGVPASPIPDEYIVQDNNDLFDSDNDLLSNSSVDDRPEGINSGC